MASDWLDSPGVGFHFRVWGHSVPLCAPLKEQAPGFRVGEEEKHGTMVLFFFIEGWGRTQEERLDYFMRLVFFIILSNAL